MQKTINHIVHVVVCLKDSHAAALVAKVSPLSRSSICVSTIHYFS